jgi:dipeptidase D
MKKLIIVTLLFITIGVSTLFSRIIGPDMIPMEEKFTNHAFEHFIEILKIPRGSHQEQKISDFLVKFANNLNLETVQDEVLNVFIRKPATEGREEDAPIILQAHLDMVMARNCDSEHDFETDPILPIIESTWIRAEGTSLGADNGIGIAIIMAVLDFEGLSHPPIEAIFTTRKEIDMGGAEAFDVSLLSGKRFINLDARSERVFIVGSASFIETKTTIPIEYEKTPENFVAYTIKVEGLKGGHSGLDINKRRANANILMGHILSDLTEVYDYRLHYIDGGTVSGAIPEESHVVLVFPNHRLNQLSQMIEEIEDAFRVQYRNETELNLIAEKTALPDYMMTRYALRNLIDLINFTTSGVLSMSPHESRLVQTSYNLATIKIVDNSIVVTGSLRSSNIDEQDAELFKMEQIASDFGLNFQIRGITPAWVYTESIILREAMKEIYYNYFGRYPDIVSVHTDMECGVFAGKLPDVEIISIGADIEDAQTVKERLNKHSFDNLCFFIVKLLENL